MSQLREMATAFLRPFRGALGTTVVIKGFHTVEWERAIGPESLVWPQIPSVRRVIYEGKPSSTIQPKRIGRVVAIPLMESDILACDAVYEKSVPAAGAVEILRNKAAFAEYLKARKLSQFAPSVYEQIDEVQYPFVLKRVDLNSSKGVRLVRSRTEYEDVRTQEPWLGYPSLLQEFIPGCVEYTMNAFFHKGRLVWTKSFSFEFEEERIKPVGYLGQHHEPTPHEREAVERILRPLGYTGPVNIDYKIRPDGRPAILEVNPRFGGSLMKPHNIEHLTRMIRLILRYAR